MYTVSDGERENGKEHNVKGWTLLAFQVEEKKLRHGIPEEIEGK